MVKTGQTWSGLVVTKDSTGALATPTVGPAGVLYVDGTANGASVTISGSNPYKWTCVLPTLTAGQCVSMYITATIATIATASVVAEDVADTVRLSDVPAVNVTMQQGVAVAAADVSGYINVLNVLGNVDGTVGEVTNLSLTGQQVVRDAMKLAPTAGAAEAGSVDAKLDDILEDTGTTLPGLIAGISAASNPWSTALTGAYRAGTAGALLSGIDSNVNLLLAVDTSTTDATTAGAISRRRGNSWALPLTIGAITGYTSLWFTIKSSYDDADSAALVQIKLNASGLSDGLLTVNGAAATNDALGSITVSDATTGAIVIALDETVTDDIAPGVYYYDAQALISGDVSTPDSGTFTVTADVTRSVT